MICIRRAVCSEFRILRPWAAVRSRAPPLRASPHLQAQLSMAHSLAGSPRVLSIQSHIVNGYVGNKAAVLPLQLLGFDVDPLNSVHFSNHPLHKTVRGQILNGEQLWDLIEGLEMNGLLTHSHLLTGYISSLSFLETIVRVVEKLRSVNKNLIYVCDPVMGDDGKLYVPAELVPVYRDKVVPLATLITPNQFEAEQLTGCKIETEAEALKAIDALHALGPQQVIITSLDIDHKLVVMGSHQRKKGEKAECFKIVMERLPAYFIGTGDLLSALLLGWTFQYPDDLLKATELAVASLHGVLKRTVAHYQSGGKIPKLSHLELRLIQSQDEITSPEVTMFAERLSAV